MGRGPATWVRVIRFTYFASECFQYRVLLRSSLAEGGGGNRSRACTNRSLALVQPSVEHSAKSSILQNLRLLSSAEHGLAKGACSAKLSMRRANLRPAVYKAKPCSPYRQAARVHTRRLCKRRAVYKPRLRRAPTAPSVCTGRFVQALLA